jgi:glycogen operon protein
LLLNAHHEEIPFTIPAPASGKEWIVLIDTANFEVMNATNGNGNIKNVRQTYSLKPRSLCLLTLRQERRANHNHVTVAAEPKLELQEVGAGSGE